MQVSWLLTVERRQGRAGNTISLKKKLSWEKSSLRSIHYSRSDRIIPAFPVGEPQAPFVKPRRPPSESDRGCVVQPPQGPSKWKAWALTREFNGVRRDR